MYGIPSKNLSCKPTYPSFFDVYTLSYYALYCFEPFTVYDVAKGLGIPCLKPRCNGFYPVEFLVWKDLFYVALDRLIA